MTVRKDSSREIPNRISVFGLGKLGLPLAVTWASRGFSVIGVDVRADVLEALSKGHAQGAEAPVDALLKRAKSRICTTTDGEEAAMNSDLSFIVVPTPSEADGGFSTRFVQMAIEPIGRAIRRKNTYHLVVVVSTVLPGSCGLIFKPLLEWISGKKCGQDFGLCYNPEFIALGEVVKGLVLPDLVLIGQSDERAGDILARMYKRFCKNEPPVSRMNLYNAELTKISINVYVTIKISFANTLAAICEQMPGGDVDEVTRTLGLDSRIGSRFLKGGLGYGGPCFPRDNRAFSHTANKFATVATLSDAADDLNAANNLRIVEKIRADLSDIVNPVVAILGLTYKPGTSVVEESAALGIAQLLISNGVHVKGYDPAGLGSARKALGERMEYSSSVEECIAGADICVIATPWDEFRTLLPSQFVKNMRHARILDCWRILNQTDAVLSQQIRYSSVGVNPHT